MENTKKGNGLVVFLIILVVLFATGLGLLLGGVIKNPFVKEEKCTKCNVETKTKKKNDKTEKKETSYYQRYILTEGEEIDKNKINYCAQEIQLNSDGTTKVISDGACSGYSWEGRYVEDDSSIALLLNSTSIDICNDRNVSQSEIFGDCKIARFMIKEDGKLIEANDDVKFFKFTKEGALETTEYKEVQKTDLLTELKN